MRVRSACSVLVLGLLIPVAVQGQATGQITGVVTSDLGQPLPGVQVSVRGQERLVSTTSENGRYLILNVPAGEHVVETSLLGFASRELPVTVRAGEPAIVDIQLQTRAIALDEVVVVGYGTQRREAVTGAVASVQAADFNRGPARDAAALIAGKMPGLAVIQPSGDPRATAQIQLRGRTTIQGPTNPLILIDGVPGSLQTVAAEDIESISVLKDGSAAAMYGSRASNGVILITTKRHQGGAPTLRYDGYLSQSRIYRRPDFLTASDYRRLINEGHDFEDLGFNTDWQSEMLRQPVSYRHNLMLTGGALNTNYTASLNVENENGIFRRSDNREITARANIRHAMFDGKLEAEANVLNRTQHYFTGPSFDYAWRQTLIRNPTDRVYDDDADIWQERTGYFYVNPVALVEEHNGEVENRLRRMHATLTLRPMTGLRFSLMGGRSEDNGLSGNATTFRHSNHTQGNSGGTAGRSTSSGIDRILEATGTYTNRFGNHNVTLLGGYSYQDFLDESFSASNSRFPTDLFGWDQLQRGTALGEGIASMSSTKSDFKVIGFFGRVNYDWQNRYLFMASLRHEGNSRFGADHKWGLFPAISAGWRVSEESFMQGLPVNDLRLRVGYGVTGIAPGSSYLSLTSYSYQTARFLYNGEWVQQLAPTRNPNPNLRWEEKSELNVGANLSLLDFRLNAAVDVYRRETRDMLYNYSVPVPPYLNGTLQANVGTMRNSGVEAELSYDVIRRNNVTWTTSANWSTNRNKLVTLSDDTFQPQSDCSFSGGTGEPIQQSVSRNCIGDPIGNFYGYKSVDIDDDGIWIVLDSAGQRISIRDATAADRHVLGNGLPKQYFGWNNTVRVGNLDMNLNMRGAAGFQILNYLRMYYENPKITQYNMLKSAFDPVYGKHRADGSPILLDHDLSYVSYYVEDGDYIKVDNLTVGYTFPQSSLGQLSRLLSGARVYVSGQNLLTITGYKGVDPEVSTSGLAPGQDTRDTYPTIRRFTTGISFNF